jgi:hypothetical protein
MKWRWISLPIALVALGLVALLVTLGTSVRSPTTGGQGATATASCPTAPPNPANLAHGLVGTWFRLDPRLDSNGSLTGQTLAWGQPSGQVWTMDLPPAASAAGPFGRYVLVALDDDVASQLRLLDAANGCSTTLARTNEVIWRATIDPRDGAIYEARLDRVTRSDLGIWRRPLNPSEPPTRVLDPLPADDLSEEFTWSLDGTRLAVLTCGQVCHVRLFDPSSGQTTTFDDPELGEVIGIGAADLVRYRHCVDVLPCPVSATQIQTGTRRDLLAAAGLAILTRLGDRELLVYEADNALGILDLASGARRSMPLAGLRLVPNPERAQSAVIAPSGWVAVSPDGRYAGLPGATASRFLHLTDGQVATPQEVLP